MRAGRRVAVEKCSLVGLVLLAAGLAGCQPPSQQPKSPQPKRIAQPEQSQAVVSQDSAAQPENSERRGSSPSASAVPPPAPSHDSADALGEASLQRTADADADAHWQTQFSAVLAGKQLTLQLADRPITPPQLGQLAQLADSLEQLLIDAGGVDDDSLPAVLTLKRLTHLRLRECPLGDGSFEQLAASGLDQLRILNVPQSQITARGIASLATLPSLVQLRLGGAQIDDAAVAQIAQLPELRSLHLIGPSLSDTALSNLAQAPKLTSFYLDDCRLSDRAWQQLFDAKPRLHVHVDQQHHDRDPHQHQH